MERKYIENLQYITLIALIAGQCVVGVDFMVGQAIYLIANLIAVFRTFALVRPLSDKVKDVSCFGITLGLILLRVCTG